MLPFRDTPGSVSPARPAVRGARWIGAAIRRHRLEEPLSWLMWLIAVALFAFWIYEHYQGPSGRPWIGMTIHTSVFAIWALVARAWLMNRMKLSRGS